MANMVEHNEEREGGMSVEELLRLAANNFEVGLICHPETWGMICDWCAEPRAMHFTPPSDDRVTPENTAGRIIVPVSGRTLVAILERMTTITAHGHGQASAALADHIIDAVARHLGYDPHPSAIILDPHPSDLADDQDD